MNLIAKDLLRQRHVDRFFGEMRKILPGWRGLPLSEAAGAYVRSGVAAGIAVLDPGVSVDEMVPSEVVTAATEIDAMLAEVLTVPNA